MLQDPILDHIMLDPVTLPSSKIVIDRGTIMRHLLSDPHDPFNRCALTCSSSMSVPTHLCSVQCSGHMCVRKVQTCHVMMDLTQECWLLHRQPLNEKDLITNDELKGKILEWKQQR